MSGFWRSKNVAIFGATQQGKSVGANEIYAKDERAGVFFAPDPEPWFTGYTANGPEDIILGLKQGKRKFVVPADLWADVEERHGELTAWVLDRCDKVNGFNVVMVHDEAQDLDSDMLMVAMKRGLKRGMRNIIVTQSPASRSVPLEALRQCDYYIWVGPIGSFDVEYINRHGLFDTEPVLNNPEHKYIAVTRQGKVIDSGFFDNGRFGDG